VNGFRRWRWFFGALAALALLMAFGTFIDRLFYFYVPGFGSSGSPARVLVLWAFAVAVLGGVGANALVSGETVCWRWVLGVLGVLAVLWAVCYVRANDWITAAWNSPGFGAADAFRQFPLLAVAAAFIGLLASGRVPRRHGAWMLSVLVACDLFLVGIGYNPTANRSEVYPETTGIRFLTENAPHERIMPINRDWSFEGPNAVLPPNAAMVFGLRDAQGYDSLFPGQYKAYLSRVLNTDPSPPQVGNMVFVKQMVISLARTLGARFALPRESVVIDRVLAEDISIAHTASAGAGLPAILEIKGNHTRASVEKPGGAVKWKVDSPTRLALDVELPEGGDLRIADQYWPGWRAMVNGAAVPIRRDSTGVFRIVSVPAGRHQVALSYVPAGFRFGLFLMSLAVAVGGYTIAFRRYAGGESRAVSPI
jgi:hypothetical protein